MSNEIEVFRLTTLEDAYNNIKNWRANAVDKKHIESYIYSFETFQNAMRGSVIKDDDLNRIFLAYMRYPIDLLYKECKNLYDDITETMEEAKAILDSHSYGFKYSIDVNCPFSLASFNKTRKIDRLQYIITFYSEVVMSLKIHSNGFAEFYTHATVFQTNIEYCMPAIIEAVKKRIK